MTDFKVSPRDQQVIDLLLLGYSNPEIAVELGISLRTVKEHLRLLAGKAGIQGAPGSQRVKLALRFRPVANPPKFRGLAPRQAEIAQLACAGSSNQEIADKLGIQVGVVKNRLREVFEKLGVWSRLELAMRYGAA